MNGSEIAIAIFGSSKATYQPTPGVTKEVPRVVLPHDAVNPTVAAYRKRAQAMCWRKEERTNKPQDKQDPRHDPKPSDLRGAKAEYKICPDRR